MKFIKALGVWRNYMKVADEEMYKGGIQILTKKYRYWGGLLWPDNRNISVSY